MITGEQIQEVWKRPIPAIKKLEWHQPFTHGVSRCINVVITGFRVERGSLRVYYDYRHPITGQVRRDVDLANQFKIK